LRDHVEHEAAARCQLALALALALAARVGDVGDVGDGDVGERDGVLQGKGGAVGALRRGVERG
jgi:hypothetical protein